MIRNLHYTESGVDENARRVRAAEWNAAGSVLSLGTTPRASDSLGNPEWRADMEYVWRSRVRGDVDRLWSRAKRQRRIAARAASVGADDGRVRALRSARWAADRARSAAMARADVMDACGGRWRTVACGCGHREIEVGCDHPALCGKCRARHWRKHRHRLVRAMDAHVRGARAEWYARRNRYGRAAVGGMPPGVYLITLTGPHSGDLCGDRERMGRAVRKLVDYGTRAGWWSAYALTWEVTNGRDGNGHLHVHMAVVSSWIPYTGEQAGPTFDVRRKRSRSRPRLGLHDVWRSAMPGALVLDVSAPGRAKSPASAAGEYLAKYVTKGVDPEELSGAKAGEMLVAFRGRRKISTSRYFWAPLRDRETCCTTCHRRHRLVSVPQSLQRHVPGAVLRAMAERIGWWIPRGSEQCELRAMLPSTDVHKKRTEGIAGGDSHGAR